MAKAIYKGIVLAESDDIEVVEGNIYFPPEAINQEYFTDSRLHTTCPWKGVASYYNLKVGDTEVRDAAWYYPNTKPAANNINGYVAFYRTKVEVER